MNMPPASSDFAPQRQAPSGPNVDYSRPLRIGLTTFAFLFVVIGGWLALAPLTSAVIAQGGIAVRGRPQVVQHLDGGIVRRIHVRNGDVVRKDDLLVSLDETLLVANLEIYRNRLREAAARKARLEAERDGLPEIVFDEATVGIAGLGDVALPRQGQKNLFLARRAARDGQVEQLREKIEQSEDQIAGVRGLMAARREQLSFIDRELAGLRDLADKGYAALNRVLAQERARAELTGEIAENAAELARIRNAIQETEITILQVHRQFQEAVLTELREVSTQVDDLVQQIVATTKQLDRVEIRAPVNGVVHELAVHTIGGVIAPGGTLMQLISMDEGLEIEANVEPQYIDQLHTGQIAVIRFPAFSQATTPELEGRISRISPTSVVDEQSGIAFYRVGVDVDRAELEKLRTLTLVPGMPAEAHIKLSERTALSYLLKPLVDHWFRAMREE